MSSPVNPGYWVILTGILVTLYAVADSVVFLLWPSSVDWFLPGNGYRIFVLGMFIVVAGLFVLIIAEPWYPRGPRDEEGVD